MMADGGDEVRYDELNNDDAEVLSDDSELTSSDGDDDHNVDEDSRPTAAALDADGPSPLAAEDDFASAVARAAQLAGLTVVGSTVTDCNRGPYCSQFTPPDKTPLLIGYYSHLIFFYLQFHIIKAKHKRTERA